MVIPSVSNNVPLPKVFRSPALPIEFQHIEVICDPNPPSQDSIYRVAAAIVTFETSFRWVN
jgi:hypothetical protein